MIIKEETPTAFLDIEIAGAKIGRVVVELLIKESPKATENFLALCSEKRYKGNHFHRVIKSFMIQAGDTTFGGENFPNDSIGKGGECIFAEQSFIDENLAPLDKPFMLAMANSGPDSNKSQFFITTFPCPHLSGKHTVFGEVIHGKSVVRDIERVATDSQNVPNDEIVIADCGIWNEAMGAPLFNACADPIGGDVFEEYPDDDLHFDKENLKEAFTACCTIKESGTLLFKKGEKKLAFFKYRKCLYYLNEFLPAEDQDAALFKEYLLLKKKVFLNISLTALQMSDWDKCILYSDYLLELEPTSIVTDQERAKALYRKGVANMNLRIHIKSRESLQAALKLCPGDVAISKAIEKVDEHLAKKKEKEKSQYSRFFS